MLGAAGYTGLLVWHGGLGGSAPLKVAESGHMAKVILNASWLNEVPDALPLSQTADGMEPSRTLSVMVVVVLTFIWLGRRIGAGEANALPQAKPTPQASEEQGDGGLADVLDRRKVVAYVLGVGCLVGASWAVNSGPLTKLAFVTPDWINMVLLGAAMLAHGQIRGMLRALDEAISGASGILVQFPLYFGIMGMVSGTGVRDVARRFVGRGDVVGVSCPKRCLFLQVC